MFIAAILLAGLLFFTAICLFLFIKKIKPGEAGVRTGFGGIKVKKDWVLRVPILQQLQIMDLSVKKLEVVRKGRDGLICEDNIRADIEVVFYVRVNDQKTELDGKVDFHDIKTVATQVGCERASEIELLKQLFEAKFSEALKSAGKKMEFEKLYTDRIPFREEIINTIGSDLNGYTLEDVAIDYLEQTPKADHDANNVLDSQGLAKIVQITAEQQELKNAREQKLKVELKDQNVRAEMETRELDKQNEEDLAKQTRAVAEAKAREEAAAQVEIQKNREVAEKADIEASQHIEERKVEQERVVMSATYSKDQDLLRLEQEKIEAGEQAEVDRERRVGLMKQEKEAKIIEAAFGVAESRAGLESKEKEVSEQHQQRLDLEADMAADRTKRVMMVEATAKAEASQKEATVAAEAEKTVRQQKAEAAQIEERTAALARKEAADHEAERIQVTADAEAKASEKRRHAMEQEAEGTAALQSAAKLAEARGMEAMAKAEEAQGLAEATVIAKQGEATGLAKSAEGKGEAEAISAQGTAEAAAVEALRLAEAQGTEKQGLADALAKTEMAKAIELFNKASQDHEEFRLQLDKDMAVDLAGINVQKDIAEAQARVVGEALKSANIDIVGGENDFFEKVVRSVSQGKAVDRLVNNSQAITDVKNTFFNGDPDYFKGQLRGWIKDLGVSSEDVKNLTISALLTKLIGQADDSGLKSVMRQAQKAAKESGMGEILSGAILGDSANK